MIRAEIIIGDMFTEEQVGGEILWDEDAGVWDFENADWRIQPELEQVRQMESIPYRDSVEQDGTIFEIETELDPGHPSFLMALSDYLMENVGWVVSLRIVG